MLFQKKLLLLTKFYFMHDPHNFFNVISECPFSFFVGGSNNIVKFCKLLNSLHTFDDLDVSLYFVLIKDKESHFVIQVSITTSTWINWIIQVINPQPVAHDLRSCC